MYSVELFGLKKDGTSLEFESRNAGKENPPVAEITVNGVVYSFEATDDAIISPDDNYATNYGTESTLCAEESVSSIGLARLTDSNTKRSLVKFDFSSLKSLGTPTKAVIRLYGRNKGSGSGEMLKQTNLGDTTFPENIQEKAYKIIKYFASLLLPGGGNPQIGDEAGYQGINYNDANRNTLLYSVCDVPFWKYLASDGKEGTAPDWTTIGFTGSENEDEFVSGVYTMRSDWSDDAFYLYTDVDGNTNPGHGHADDNKIIMQAYGQYLLTDQSFSSYATQRIPLDSTKYHNTVYIDSVDQNRWEYALYRNVR